MIDADDYIENETENGRPALSTIFDTYPLALKLEMQEEIDFQMRLAKEQGVISKIKQIAQARLEYAREWLKSAKNGTRTVNEFINSFINLDVFLKQSKKGQEEMRARLDLTDWTEGIKADKCFFKNIINKINCSIPYLLEALYLEAHNYEIQVQHFVTKFHNKNNTPQYVSIFLKMLYPFLTREFHCFFAKIKNTPLLFGSAANLRQEKVKLNNSINLDVNSEMLRQLVLLKGTTMSRAKKNSKFNHVTITELLEKLDVETQRIESIVLHEDEVLAREVKVAIDSSPSKYIDLTMLPFWKRTRSNFSLLYNSFRQIEEINYFLDEWILKIKIKRVVLPAEKKLIIEAVEQVPDLDDVFLEKTVQQDETTNDFIISKKQQLFLWQERVKQRKEQKEQWEQIQQVRVEMDKLDRQHAEQLDGLYKKIDEADKLLYCSLFKSDSSCKPHNVHFRDIEKLIKNFGGILKNDSGSSHFSVHLPDTYSLWTEDNVGATLSYMDIPEVTGGSYKPHGHSGEEWTRSAHDLLKKAFIKAGITPERLSRSTQVMRVKV